MKTAIVSGAARFVDGNSAHELAKAICGKTPQLTLPKWALQTLGRFCESISGFTGKVLDRSAGIAFCLSTQQFALTGNAARELGSKASPINDCIQSTLTWYRANGYDL